MARDAAWLASLQPAPANAARADEISFDQVTTGRLAVWADLQLQGGRRQLPAIATGWTRQHVRLEVSVPGRGTMLLWLPAVYVTRRDD